MSALTPASPEIDPAHLWCIWGWLPYVEHSLGNPSLRFQSWVLASPGQAGLDEITSQRGHSTENVIAALSLEQLRQCLDLFQAPTASSLPSVLSKFISSIRAAPVHLVRRNGRVQFIPKTKGAVVRVLCSAVQSRIYAALSKRVSELSGKGITSLLPMICAQLPLSAPRTGYGAGDPRPTKRSNIC